MAVDLALSLRQWHSEPIAIAVDAAMEAYIASHYPSVFDFVLRLPAEIPAGWACKLAVAEVSPFARTVFIDADTIVLGTLQSILADAEWADFAMMGHFCTAPTSQLHNGLSIEWVIREFGLARFFSNASCLFVFERTYGRRFLAECLDVWLTGLTHTSPQPFWGPGDEVAFGIVAGRRGMTTLREPFSIYWLKDVPSLRSDNRWKPLCHMHNPLPRQTMKWLMTEVVERRRRAGLSCSIEHWFRKLSSKGALGLWNWNVRRHIAKYVASRSDHSSVASPASIAPPTEEGIVEYLHPLDRTSRSQLDGAAWMWTGKEDEFADSRSASNLLLHRTRRRQIVSMPDTRLRVRELWDRDAEVPVVLAAHCWPGIPEGMGLSLGWRRQDGRYVLGLTVDGPLPEHPESVLCIRFRGRQVRCLDPARDVLVNLRARLLSKGAFRKSVVAVGSGIDYLVGVTLGEGSSTVDSEFFVRARPWPAPYAELFVEFRLSLADVDRSTGNVEVAFSCFYLGQVAEDSVFGGRPDAPVFAAS
ncbi:MAG: hypothetical protein JSR24_07860 [Proteobacteria bacterium]|nr:hypothetical protein [Pseudomonadota bacterium]